MGTIDDLKGKILRLELQFEVGEMSDQEIREELQTMHDPFWGTPVELLERSRLLRTELRDREEARRFPREHRNVVLVNSLLLAPKPKPKLKLKPKPIVTRRRRLQRGAS